METLYFKYTYFPSCCALGIIHDIFLSQNEHKHLEEEVTKKQRFKVQTNQDFELYFKEFCKERTINTIYATYVVDSKEYEFLIMMGFVPIDLNFNNNTENNVITLKYTCKL